MERLAARVALATKGGKNADSLKAELAAAKTALVGDQSVMDRMNAEEAEEQEEAKRKAGMVARKTKDDARQREYGDAEDVMKQFETKMAGYNTEI